MTTILIITLLILAAIAAWTLVRGGTRKEREPEYWTKYLLRYRGGAQLCRTCGEPTMYSDNRGPIHPGCRDAA